MLDADIIKKIIQFNDALYTNLGNSKFLIPIMVNFNLKYNGFQPPPWDPEYRNNTSTGSEYIFMANKYSRPEDDNIYSYEKYIDM